MRVSKWTYLFSFERFRPLLFTRPSSGQNHDLRFRFRRTNSNSGQLGPQCSSQVARPARLALALVKPTRAPPTRPHTNKRAPMAAAGNGETTALPPQQQEPSPAPPEGAASGGGVIAALEEQWRKTKEHAETYPYVWGSYILVYGGLGAYLAWRWGKLRRTEDRVRVLQERLRKLAAAEESQAAPGSASTTPTPPPPPPQQPAAGPAKPASGP